MRAAFVEFSVFARYRQRYLDDDAFQLLQEPLMRAPELGVLIQGGGGLRKLRMGKPRRGIGKRAGLRVIYFYWSEGAEFWLFTIYAKGEVADLTPEEKSAFRAMLKSELLARRTHEGKEKKSLR